MTDDPSHRLVSGRVVLAETKNVLTEKFVFTRQKVDCLLKIMEWHEIVPIPKTLSSIPGLDLGDALVLASALEAGADVLVTGRSGFTETGRQSRNQNPRSARPMGPADERITGLVWRDFQTACALRQDFPTPNLPDWLDAVWYLPCGIDELPDF